MSAAGHRVRDVMESGVVLVEASKTVLDAAKLMADKNVWSLVVSRDGSPVGVVTERDLIRRCYAKGLNPQLTKLDSVMSSPLVTIDPEATTGQALALMAEKNIRRVYVVEKGKIIGRVTQTSSFNQMLNVMMSLSSLSSIV